MSAAFALLSLLDWNRVTFPWSAIKIYVRLAAYAKEPGISNYPRWLLNLTFFPNPIFNCIPDFQPLVIEICSGIFLHELGLSKYLRNR